MLTFSPLIYQIKTRAVSKKKFLPTATPLLHVGSCADHQNGHRLEFAGDTGIRTAKAYREPLEKRHEIQCQMTQMLHTALHIRSASLPRILRRTTTRIITHDKMVDRKEN